MKLFVGVCIGIAVVALGYVFIPGKCQFNNDQKNIDSNYDNFKDII
jgi:hypothetical protein